MTVHRTAQTHGPTSQLLRSGFGRHWTDPCTTLPCGAFSVTLTTRAFDHAAYGGLQAAPASRLRGPSPISHAACCGTLLSTRHEPLVGRRWGRMRFSSSGA
jgi:hypothetical protein